MKNNKTFILSSNCKLVRGIKRCTIIDFERGDLYFLSEEYFSLLNTMDRQALDIVENSLDSEESINNFKEFISIICSLEIGFLTDHPERFPIRSEENFEMEMIELIDVIMEIESSSFNSTAFTKLCKDLETLRCKDFQIRLFSMFDFKLLTEVVEIITNTANANYIEIHCNYTDGIEKKLHAFIENNSLVNYVYIYGSKEAKIIDVVNYIPDHYPLIFGKIYYLNYSFDNGNCCGIINQDSLDYSSLDVHNKLKTRNGCLDRKITIDRFGNVKNCPSMQNNYGNIKDISIKEVIKKKEFQKYWFIHKDEINICKVCEFRYNCTDCRAFLQDPNDIYSKPLKCGYDPYSMKWEDWSVNRLKEQGRLIK